MRKLFCIVFWLPLMVVAQGEVRTQKAENYIFEGNEAFDALDGVAAEKNYRRAIATGTKTDIARFNMGATLQQDNYMDEALRAYADVTKTTKERPNKHRTFHNIGNALMQIKDYKGAVEAYKNALRNNPNDDETRYNYALAKKMLEDENQDQDQDQKEDQDNQDNQDQQKDQNQDQEGENDKEQEGENQQDNKDESEEEGENEKDEQESDKNDEQDQQGDNEKEQQPPQESPAQLSPQQVQNLLEAMNNEEKKVQDKVNAKKAKAVGTKSKKDW